MGGATGWATNMYVLGVFSEGSSKPYRINQGAKTDGNTLLFDASDSNSYYVDSAVPRVNNVPCYALIKA